MPIRHAVISAVRVTARLIGPLVMAIICLPVKPAGVVLGNSHIETELITAIYIAGTIVIQQIGAVAGL